MQDARGGIKSFWKNWDNLQTLNPSHNCSCFPIAFNHSSILFFSSPSLHVLISISPCLSDTHSHTIYYVHTFLYPFHQFSLPFPPFLCSFLLFSFHPPLPRFMLVYLFSLSALSFSFLKKIFYVFTTLFILISLLSLFIKHLLRTRCSTKYVEL